MKIGCWFQSLLQLLLERLDLGHFEYKQVVKKIPDIPITRNHKPAIGITKKNDQIEISAKVGDFIRTWLVF